MKRVKELSHSTQRLDSESPPKNALIAVINKKETGAQFDSSKSKDIDEEDWNKAKEWISQYTALQQSKKLALHDWFRLSFGRRQLKAATKAHRFAIVCQKSFLQPNNTVIVRYHLVEVKTKRLFPKTILTNSLGRMLKNR